jgi:uncharacterized Zn finger protein (UPF0148 family)
MNNNPTAGITRPFVREERYYVLKISDMRKYLSREKFEFVGAVAEKLNAGRAVDGKTVLQAVVVEHDWPEYERVWQMIETRMVTTRRQFLNCNNDRRFWAIPASGDETEVLRHPRWQCKCGTRYWAVFNKGHCPSCGKAAVTAKTDAKKAVDEIMEHAQIFASAWSLVGGRFDGGNAMDDAEEAKAELRVMVASLANAATTPQPKQEQGEPVATFDEVWDSIDWDEWRMKSIRDLVKMIHSKTHPQHKQRYILWPVKGVRVDGDKVIIMAKGGNDAARWLCGEILFMATDIKAQP